MAGFQVGLSACIACPFYLCCLVQNIQPPVAVFLPKMCQSKLRQGVKYLPGSEDVTCEEDWKCLIN